MSKIRIDFLLIVFLLLLVALGCSSMQSDRQNANLAVSSSSTPIKTIVNEETDGAASTSGSERQKPAPGKGNVQGKVYFNDQPVEGIEIKICEDFSTILGIQCKGKTSTAKTDRDGVFVLADLEPLSYGGLTAKVFKSDYYVYPQEGIMTPQRFAVEADRTIFADDIHLFKDDIKITNPKSGAKVDAKNLELKWDAYPNAAYYKITVTPDDGSASPISGERVDDPNYQVTENLANGKYSFQVVAFNANNHKLAETGSDIKFTVTSGSENGAAK